MPFEETKLVKRVKQPQILKVEKESIPSLLKAIPRWVLWKVGPAKSNGKFPKIPINPKTGRPINALAPENWLAHSDAISAYEKGKGDGVGIVLVSDQPVVVDGDSYILTALDFDDCMDDLSELKALWSDLDRPYVELSPSGKGLRMFALCTDPLKGGNDGEGHELYSAGRFLTVTGQRGRGTIKDCTPGLKSLHNKWFVEKLTVEKKTLSRADPGSQTRKVDYPSSIPETEDNIEILGNLLSSISADCDYEKWRNLVWSTLSSGLSCAEQIAREWSKSAPSRFAEEDFDKTVGSFDPNRGISIGTLEFHARQAGYSGMPLSRGHRSFDAPNSRYENISSATGPSLLTAEEVKRLPIQAYRIRGLLPAVGMAAIYGEPGSGKSFLALDLAMSIANGHKEWFGRRVTPSPVVYVALEGRGGISKRIMAWESHQGEKVSDEIRFLLGEFSLREGAAIERLAMELLSKVGVGAVVIIDTLNQSAPGADENSSADMSMIITNAKLLMQRIDGLVLLVHHAGKDRNRGLRGHSSLLAALDTVLEVINIAGARSWIATKTKDDELGATGDFELAPYQVGNDDDGTPVMSCAVRPAIHQRSRARRPVQGARQQAAMAALRVPLADGRALTVSEAVSRIAEALDVPDGRRITSAKDVIANLIHVGYLSSTDGCVTLPS